MNQFQFISLAFALGGVVLLGAGCPINEQGDTVDYEEDVYPLIEEFDSGKTVRGSCNVIAEKSSCVDYLGSIWTEEQMRLNCQDVGAFSLNTCPYSDIGGCASTPGTFTETIIWMYNQGANPVTPEDAPYAAAACNAGPASEWVTPEYLLPSNN